MTPAQALKTKLRAHGYTVYDIGNEAHLVHEPPEDHTPYSETTYPGKSVYGVGYAIDVMPPAKGARSKIDGLPLPSLQQLGAQMLADRKAGVPGIKWLKYMNWEPERNNGGPCYQDSWKPNYARRTSSDRGHIHMSGLTGYENSTIGAGYDPVTRIRGGDDMSEEAEQKIDQLSNAVFVGGSSMGRAVDPDGAGAGKASNSLVAKIDYTMLRLDQVATALTALAGKDLVDERAVAAELAPLVLAGLSPEKIAAAIPPTIAKQVADELARRLVGEQQG